MYCWRVIILYVLLYIKYYTWSQCLCISWCTVTVVTDQRCVGCHPLLLSLAVSNWWLGHRHATAPPCVNTFLTSLYPLSKPVIIDCWYQDEQMISLFVFLPIKLISWVTLAAFIASLYISISFWITHFSKYSDLIMKRSLWVNMYENSCDYIINTLKDFFLVYFLANVSVFVRLGAGCHFSASPWRRHSIAESLRCLRGGSSCSLELMAEK